MDSSGLGIEQAFVYTIMNLRFMQLPRFLAVYSTKLYTFFESCPGENLLNMVHTYDFAPRCDAPFSQLLQFLLEMSLVL
jgi:hypothetical protein